jgi:hypothetical protein
MTINKTQSFATDLQNWNHCSGCLPFSRFMREARILDREIDPKHDQSLFPRRTRRMACSASLGEPKGLAGGIADGKLRVPRANLNFLTLPGRNPDSPKPRKQVAACVEVMLKAL